MTRLNGKYYANPERQVWGFTMMTVQIVSSILAIYFLRRYRNHKYFLVRNVTLTILQFFAATQMSVSYFLEEFYLPPISSKLYNEKNPKLLVVKNELCAFWLANTFLVIPLFLSAFIAQAYLIIHLTKVEQEKKKLIRNNNNLDGDDDNYDVDIDVTNEQQQHQQQQQQQQQNLNNNNNNNNNNNILMIDTLDDNAYIAGEVFFAMKKKITFFRLWKFITWSTLPFMITLTILIEFDYIQLDSCFIEVIPMFTGLLLAVTVGLFFPGTYITFQLIIAKENIGYKEYAFVLTTYGGILCIFFFVDIWLKDIFFPQNIFFPWLVFQIWIWHFINVPCLKMFLSEREAKKNNDRNNAADIEMGERNNTNSNNNNNSSNDMSNDRGDIERRRTIALTAIHQHVDEGRKVSKEEFVNIIEMSSVRSKFLQFLQGEFNSENLLFIFAVRNFLVNKAPLNLASKIIKIHIVTMSPLEINISHKSRNNIIAEYEALLRLQGRVQFHASNFTTDDASAAHSEHSNEGGGGGGTNISSSSSSSGVDGDGNEGKNGSTSNGDNGSGVGGSEESEGDEDQSHRSQQSLRGAGTSDEKKQSSKTNQLQATIQKQQKRRQSSQSSRLPSSIGTLRSQNFNLKKSVESASERIAQLVLKHSRQLFGYFTFEIDEDLLEERVKRALEDGELESQLKFVSNLLMRLKVREIQSRSVLYFNSFLGSDAVDFIVSNKNLQTDFAISVARKNARMKMEELRMLGLLSNPTYSYPFVDSSLHIYRFEYHRLDKLTNLVVNYDKDKEKKKNVGKTSNNNNNMKENEESQLQSESRKTLNDEVIASQIAMREEMYNRSVHLFDDAFDEIMLYLQIDCFPRFLLKYGKDTIMAAEQKSVAAT